MGQNYEAWEVQLEDFYRHKSLADRLKFLVRFAVLAPSSHNSQPWKFEVRESEILLTPEYSRALTKGDPENRLLFVSLGCALENLLLAGEHYGLGHEIEVQDEGYILARFYEKVPPQDEESKKEKIIKAILTRRVNRNKYERGAPSEDFLSRATSLPQDPDVNVRIILDEKLRTTASDITNRAGRDAFADQAFREELAAHMTGSYTSSPLGMPGFSMGMPALISYLAPLLVPIFGLPKKIQKENEELLLKHTPAFVVVSTKDDTVRAQIEAGRLSQRIMLIAEMEKLSTHPLAASVVVGEYWIELQELLGTNFRPQFFMRLGHAILSARHSPRLRAEEVT